jgi:alkanesulfonate monooxygenase SsuD/methylene tetrahydromethanopterin reductase-like flavin-dependent oxidoreductase (luciferase family)
MPDGVFLASGGSLPEILDHAELAEELGYDSVWVTRTNAYEPLLLLGAVAARTRRVRLGTGINPIYTGTPAHMAQSAATLDQISGGRHVLGLGVSHRPLVEAWHGHTIDRPGTEQREYVQIVRAILRGEAPPSDTYKFRSQFALDRALVRPDLPIYISALSPRMLEIAGEVADGVVLWLCNPAYVRDVVVPHVAAGRARAGRTMEGFEVVAAVPAGLVDDVERARASMRRQLLPYFGLPFYRAMIERSGFADEVARFDVAAASADVTGMQAAVSDRFLDAQSAVGDAVSIRSGLGRFRAAGVTSPCIGPVATADVRATLSAAAPAAQPS